MWYINKFGNVTGPYSEDQINKLIRNNQLTKLHKISEDRSSWIRVDNSEFWKPQSLAPQELAIPESFGGGRRGGSNAGNYAPDYAYGMPEDTASATNYAQQKSNTSLRAKVTAAVAAMVVVAVGVIAYGVLSGGNDETKLAKFYQKHRQSVGVVVYALEDKYGNKLPIPCGTAFAVSRNKFITNAHVAYGIKTAVNDFIAGQFWNVKIPELAQKAGANDLESYCKNLGEERLKEEYESFEEKWRNDGLRVDGIEIRLSSSFGRSLRVSAVQPHPRWAMNGGNANNECDVAALIVDGEAPNILPLADSGYLHRLMPGMKVASAGFPMEGFEDGDMDVDNPEATYATGDIKKLTNYQKFDAGKENNRTITHSIPGAGGASGSPLFTADGVVIGVLWGVHHMADGYGQRTPSGLLHNWAVRIDQIRDLGEMIPCKMWINEL